MSQRLTRVSAILARHPRHPWLRDQLERRRQELALLERVRAHLPPAMRAHCLDAELAGDELVLTLESPAWATRARFLAGDLIAALAGGSRDEVSGPKGSARPKETPGFREPAESAGARGPEIPTGLRKGAAEPKGATGPKRPGVPTGLRVRVRPPGIAARGDASGTTAPGGWPLGPRLSGKAAAHLLAAADGMADTGLAEALRRLARRHAADAPG